MALPRLNPHAALEASRMALLFAIRRDWAPRTVDWTPVMQETLMAVAIELQAEALASMGRTEGFALS